MYNVRFKCTYIMSAKLNKHSRLERTRGAPFGARLGRPVWIGLGAPSLWGAKSALFEGF